MRGKLIHRPPHWQASKVPPAAPLGHDLLAQLPRSPGAEFETPALERPDDRVLYPHAVTGNLTLTLPARVSAKISSHSSTGVPADNWNPRSLGSPSPFKSLRFDRCDRNRNPVHAGHGFPRWLEDRVVLRPGQRGCLRQRTGHCHGSFDPFPSPVPSRQVHTPRTYRLPVSFMSLSGKGALTTFHHTVRRDPYRGFIPCFSRGGPTSAFESTRCFHW